METKKLKNKVGNKIESKKLQKKVGNKIESNKKKI